VSGFFGATLAMENGQEDLNVGLLGKKYKKVKLFL
jgi:hypothetical protein